MAASVGALWPPFNRPASAPRWCAPNNPFAPRARAVTDLSHKGRRPVAQNRTPAIVTDGATLQFESWLLGEILMAKKKNKSKAGSESAKARAPGTAAAASNASGSAKSEKKAASTSGPSKGDTKKGNGKDSAVSAAQAAIIEVFESGNFAAVRQIADSVEAGGFPSEVVETARATKARVTIDPVALGIGIGGVLLVVTVVLAALSTPG